MSDKATGFSDAMVPFLHRGPDQKNTPRAARIAATGRIAASDLARKTNDWLLEQTIKSDIDRIQQFTTAGHIDPLTHPADPRLIERWGIQNTARTGVLPWRSIGAVTVVLLWHSKDISTHVEALETCFGPVCFARATQDQITKSISRCCADTLIPGAETRSPETTSCRQIDPTIVQLATLGLAAVLVLTLILAPSAMMIGAACLALATLIASTCLKAVAVLSKPKSPIDPAKIVAFDPPRFSILVPLFQEKYIAEHLVQRLQKLTYPKSRLEVCLVVEADDVQTNATLAELSLPDWIRIIHVPRGSVKTKPRAMNYALDFCRGSIIGIYDAEDAPDANQLEQVALHFSTAGQDVACLQGALDFYNPRQNWVSRCFTIEYATWFRAILPALQWLGWVIPLGGTTLFFRRNILEDLGGWDAHNVTEDADLGVRLARAGYRTEIVDTTTYEEANYRPWPWIKQRSRWLKGYALTYAIHMKHPIKLLSDLGIKRFIGFQVLFAGTIIQFTLAPLLWSLWTATLIGWYPFAESLSPYLMFALMMMCLPALIVNFALYLTATRSPQHRHLWGWSIAMMAYFPMASLAMYKAIREIITSPFSWDKTQHGIEEVQQTS